MNKQILTTRGIIIIVLVAGAVGAIILFLNAGIEQDYCKKIAGELSDYIETKNYCSDVSDCQVVWMTGCDFGLTGRGVDLDYIGKVLSEFYSPDGECWTGIAPECEDPGEGKSIKCIDSKCTLQDDYQERVCEDYTYEDCPEGCYPYFGRPSSCGIEADGTEICTDDLNHGCSSE